MSFTCDHCEARPLVYLDCGCVAAIACGAHVDEASRFMVKISAASRRAQISASEREVLRSFVEANIGRLSAAAIDGLAVAA